ncbi:MAG: helix-turn-helix domain containing protein [Clostridia bacterium]|nr:helix-turn-helix domain containing protein [Clostridia bacterium]
MGKKKYTYEQKLEAVLNILDKHMSIMSAAKLLGCGKTTLNQWLRLYQEHGCKGLTVTHRTYTGDFKVNTVKYIKA